jgi:hypothetical protein
VLVAPRVRGGAAAQARDASRSGDAAGHVAAKAIGVIFARACRIRRWLQKSRHRSVGCRASASVSKLRTMPFWHGDPGSM